MINSFLQMIMHLFTEQRGTKCLGFFFYFFGNSYKIIAIDNKNPDGSPFISEDTFQLIFEPKNITIHWSWIIFKWIKRLKKLFIRSCFKSWFAKRNWIIRLRLEMVRFGVLLEWYININGIFNGKSVLIKVKQWYYYIYCCRDNRVNKVLHGINSKINAIP